MADTTREPEEQKKPTYKQIVGERLKQAGKTAWGELKNLGISHLAQLVGIPFGLLGIDTIPLPSWAQPPRPQSGAGTGTPAAPPSGAGTPPQPQSGAEPPAQPPPAPRRGYTLKTVGINGEEETFDLANAADINRLFDHIDGITHYNSTDTTQSLFKRLASMNQGNEREDIKGILQRALEGSNNAQEITDKLNAELDNSYNAWTYLKNKKGISVNYEDFRQNPSAYLDGLTETEKRELETLQEINPETNAFVRGNIGSHHRIAHFKAEDFEIITPDPELEPEPEPEPEPQPNFKAVEEAHQAITGSLQPLYKGIGVEEKIGGRGMRAGDGDINQILLSQEEQSFQQAQAEMQRNADLTRGLENAKLNTQTQLDIQQFLHTTQYEPSLENRQSAYDTLVQRWMTNPAISPKADGLSPEQQLDRTMLLQQALDKLATAAQRSALDYNREQFLTDASNTVQSLIGMTARGEDTDEENFGRMQAQILQAQSSMPPEQFSRFAQNSANSFLEAVQNRQVQTAIQKASEREELVDVNGVLQFLSESSEEVYFPLLTHLFDKADSPAVTKIFQNKVTSGMIEARKTMQDYNAGVFKAREGLYQVWSNHGMLNPARSLGEEWREKLDRAVNTGGVEEAAQAVIGNAQLIRAAEEYEALIRNNLRKELGQAEGDPGFQHLDWGKIYASLEDPGESFKAGVAMALWMSVPFTAIRTLPATMNQVVHKKDQVEAALETAGNREEAKEQVAAILGDAVARETSDSWVDQVFDQRYESLAEKEREILADRNRLGEDARIEKLELLRNDAEGDHFRAVLGRIDSADFGEAYESKWLFDQVELGYTLDSEGNIELSPDVPVTLTPELAQKFVELMAREAGREVRFDYDLFSPWYCPCFDAKVMSGIPAS